MKIVFIGNDKSAIITSICFDLHSLRFANQYNYCFIKAVNPNEYNIWQIYGVYGIEVTLKRSAADCEPTPPLDWWPSSAKRW